jgi:hypothetical protein
VLWRKYKSEIFLRRGARTCVLISLFASLACSAYATDTPAPNAGLPETLPDGNLRDPMPSEQVLSDLARQSLNNMVHFDSGSFGLGKGDAGLEIGPEGDYCVAQCRTRNSVSYLRRCRPFFGSGTELGLCALASSQRRK